MWGGDADLVTVTLATVDDGVMRGGKVRERHRQKAPYLY